MDPHQQHERDRDREDEEYDRRLAQERSERRVQNGSIDYLDDFRPTVYGVAVHLKTLKEEHCNPGLDGVDAGKVAENRAWIADQLHERGVEYEDVQSVAFGIAVDQADLLVAELEARSPLTPEDLKAFLIGRLADTWIDSALTMATFMAKTGGDSA